MPEHLSLPAIWGFPQHQDKVTRGARLLATTGCSTDGDPLTIRLEHMIGNHGSSDAQLRI